MIAQDVLGGTIDKVLEYGGLGIAAIIIVGLIWLARYYVPRVIDAATALVRVVERQTAAIEEGNMRSCEEHKRMCGQLEKQNDALLTLNAEIKARNGRHPQPTGGD